MTQALECLPQSPEFKLQYSQKTKKKQTKNEFRGDGIQF
jgi:hypothetical protein